MTGDLVVVIRDVLLTYEGRRVLSGVSLSIGERQRLVVLGSSGSGKSTLLRLILGIIRPTQGKISVFNHYLTKLSRQKLNDCRRRMGMVFQKGALISSMTVRENLLLPLKELTQHTAGEMERIVDEKLEWVSLKDAKNRLPSELSGGMIKRASLARALTLSPRLILYDEPTAGLDPINTKAIDELIVDLTERTSATSVIVTHDLESAFRVGTHMALLHEGRIAETGSTDDFRNADNPLVTEFFAGHKTASPQAETLWN